ncbi:MAG: AAA family ATPase [Enterococcus sp.]
MENLPIDPQEKIEQLLKEMEKVIYGKREVLRLTIVALLAGGHVLLEDVPGVGKTLLVKTLAKAIQGKFSRVQFTPDLLPNDILGLSIFNAQTKQFEFRPGPIFTTVLLADEINRTTPRTQAALLEAMSEGHVTIDNHTYPLDAHFFVLATQNPIDYEGTYVLPEAQLDRFLFRLQIGYPAFEEELALLLNDSRGLETIQTVLSNEEVDLLKQAVNEVYLDPAVARYALELISATRNHPQILLGISPRGGNAFVHAAKAYALTNGRNYVSPQDLQTLIPYVFQHRLLFRNTELSDLQIDSLFEELIQSIPVPVR